MFLGTEVQKVQPESGKGGGGRGGNGPTEADEAPVNYPRYYNLSWGSDLHFVSIITSLDPLVLRPRSPLHCTELHGIWIKKQDFYCRD